MRTTYKVLAYLLALEVLVQGMAMAYAIAGLGHWIDNDGGVANKALFDSDNADFPGVGGFMIHGLNGTLIIPVLALLLLITSLFTKLPGATKRAGIIIGLIIVQVVLGIAAFDVPYVITLHVLNAFGIFFLAFQTAHRLRGGSSTDAPDASVAVNV